MSYNNNKWHRRYLNLAKEVSTFSKDPSTKVGAVVVNDLGQIVGTGYNGFPRGVEDTEDRYNDRETKYKFVVHAEVNAVLLAGDKARGSTLYVYPAFGSPPVCSECCKVLIQADIKRIVGFTAEQNEKTKRWEESIGISRIMCAEAGIELVEVPV